MNLLVANESWQRSIKLIPAIEADFARFPNNRNQIERKINFAHNLVKIRQESHLKPSKFHNIADFAAIKSFLDETSAQAQAIAYPQAESYILGLKGQIKEENQQWAAAKTDTQKALSIAQNLNAPEIVYLWQWQLGRINQATGERQSANRSLFASRRVT